MLKAIKRSDDVVILPADKGNAAVVMNHAQYVEKMEDMLIDKTYEKLGGSHIESGEQDQKGPEGTER